MSEITIYSTLRNGAGDEIKLSQTSGNLYPASAAAHEWAHGALDGCDDPDAYVEHVWSQSKPKPAMGVAEFLGGVGPTLDW